ncbi:MAG: hypothetical protein KF729_10875 [Sandaracinaceae bacterium]|nr:hypothetical protein [Sandaracinaceae bacterium]
MGLVSAPDGEEAARPSGLPEGASEKRRVSTPEGELVSLRPPKRKSDPPPRRESKPPRGLGGTHRRSDPPSEPPRAEAPPGLAGISTSARRRLELALEEERASEPDDTRPHEERAPDGPRAPVGLTELSTSARQRLELALDADDTSPKLPVGLKNLTTSARQRLELAIDADDADVFDPAKPPALAPERLSAPPTGLVLDASGRRTVASLARWIGFCGLITLAVGALTGLSYLTGEGSVAHVVIGILATAVAIWQLLAVWELQKVLRDRQQRHHVVHALGHVRSALLLKALLVCAAMVLGCFTFSVAGSLLFLLG